MATFKEFIAEQALRDKLPFDMDFEIRPESSGVYETIGNIQIPVFGELLSREAWFFESLESINSSKKSDLQLVLRSLAKKLKTACGLENLTVAIEQLFDPTPLVLNSLEYEEFVDNNQIDLQRITELFRITQSVRAIDWFRVGFFLLSRVDAEWTLAQTAALRQSQLDAIASVIVKEANGGVEPEAVVAEGDEGKSAKETGKKSTGK